MVEKDIYLGKTLTIKMHVEIKKRLISGNACYHSAQNISLPVFYQTYKFKYIQNNFCPLICTSEKLSLSYC